MTAIEVIRELLKSNSITQTTLARSLNLKPGTLSARLAPERVSSLSVSLLNQMAHCIGYKLVLVPAGIKTPGYELDDGLDDPLD